MVINCCRCGRPVCDITPIELAKGERVALRGVVAALGVELESLDIVLNPEPAKIAFVFQVRCSPDDAAMCESSFLSNARANATEAAYRG